MTAAFALVTGRLHGEPITRPTRTGGQFATCKLRVVNGVAVEWWNVIAFTDAAREELAGLADGEAFSAVGALEIETYQKNGETRIARRLITDRVMALKPRRKAKGQKRDGAGDPGEEWAGPT
ncbi:single-stranded DNA-binding protein [Rhodoblastus sp.]|uniref:single-stranded DNA-binding protein n=1 Tax=Rhodoblastus sp. TaxID=1962975 RepID=UPI003F9B3869